MGVCDASPHELSPEDVAALARVVLFMDWWLAADSDDMPRTYAAESAMTTAFWDANRMGAVTRARAIYGEEGAP